MEPGGWPTRMCMFIHKHQLVGGMKGVKNSSLSWLTWARTLSYGVLKELCSSSKAKQSKEKPSKAKQGKAKGPEDQPNHAKASSIEFVPHALSTVLQTKNAWATIQWASSGCKVETFVHENRPSFERNLGNMPRIGEGRNPKVVTRDRVDLETLGFDEWCCALKPSWIPARFMPQKAPWESFKLPPTLLDYWLVGPCLLLGL